MNSVCFRLSLHFSFLNIERQVVVYACQVKMESMNWCSKTVFLFIQTWLPLNLENIVYKPHEV